jgi:hypothetical protein
MIVAQGMLNAGIKKTALICIFVALCSFTGAGFAGEMIPDHLTVEVADITYLNNDEYLVEITIGNRSGGALELEGYEASFSAQSEILGQWIELDRRMAAGPAHSGGLAMAGAGKWNAKEIITLSPAAPHLYRNHDGDVNVRFRYKLTFTGAFSPGDGTESGESAYWVKPRTNQWVLREGM